MFWKRKVKCPVTEEDRQWIEEKIDWAHINIIDIQKQPTFLPTKKYFDIDFTGQEEEAHELLEVLSLYFQINPDRIHLGFYSEETHELDRGIVTQRDDDKGTAGLYIQDGHSNTILIEVQQLKNPQSLIATMAHELSHYILMEEKGYFFEEDENEWLTDLTSIAFGFGIFMGNTKFNFNQWQSADGWGGWSSSTQGYLPEQMIAYAMAFIQFRKKEMEVEWIHYLEGDFRRHFEKGMKYLNQRNE